MGQGENANDAMARRIAALRADPMRRPKFLGPAAAVRELAAFAIGEENGVARVCKGRDGSSAAGRCFAVDVVQRIVMGFLAEPGVRLLTLVGEEGSGRSAVAARLEGVLAAAAPALRVVRVSFSRRRRHGDPDLGASVAWALWRALSPAALPETTAEASTNVSTLLERSGERCAGLVVVVDDFGDAADTPSGQATLRALSPQGCVADGWAGDVMLRGVRLVAVTNGPLERRGGRRLPFSDIMPADRRVVVLDSGEALADRLWAHATRRRPDAVKEENRFAFQTAALIFEAAAEELGESDAAAFSRVVAVVAACRRGVSVADVAGVARVDEAAVRRVVDALGPALHAGGGLLSFAGGDVARAAERRAPAPLPHGDCAAIVDLVQRRAAEDGTSAKAYLGLGCQLLRRQCEASDAFSPRLAELATDPRFLESDEARRDGGEAVVALWTRAGLDGVAARLRAADPYGDRGAARCERRVRVGELLSRAGRFQDARTVLNDAVAGLDGDGGDGAVGPTAALGVRGAAASAVARNEIRYWDSKRDWGSPESLQLLLDSSQLAVLYLEDAVPKRPQDLARARVSVANGCFKAGCVCDPRGDRAFAYFRDAHASLARVPEALAGEPGGRVAAEASLVSAVTTMCEAHALSARHRGPPPAPGDDARHYLDVAVEAVAKFYEAEFQLRGAVGETSEPSIYTFGNLSEAYLHVLHELPLGILHERKGCDVAVKALGADHPNAARKLAEFADVLAQIGMPDLAVGARRGAVPPPEELVGRLGRPPWDHILPEIARPRRVALRRTFARLGIPRSFWDDVGVPPAMVELAIDDHSDDDDVAGLPLTEPLDDDDDGDDGFEGPAVAGTTAVAAPPAPADLSPTVEMHAVASGLLMYNPDAPGHS